MNASRQVDRNLQVDLAQLNRKEGRFFDDHFRVSDVIFHSVEFYAQRAAHAADFLRLDPLVGLKVAQTAKAALLATFGVL